MPPRPIADDAHGGDTNGDGTATSPASSDWNGITVSVSGSTFDHCQFYYAGANNTAALGADGTSVTVTNSVFGHDKRSTDSIAAVPTLDLRTALAGTVVTGNVFYDNLVPLGISAAFSLDDSNAFNNSAAAPSQPQPSKYNGIVVEGGDHVTATITWAATKVPFTIGDQTSGAETVS